VSTSRKGLKRLGLSRYLITGPVKNMIVERDAPYRFYVRPQNFPQAPHGFFAQEFKRLKDARKYAEFEAGL
jgi:hypothetical protein